MGFVGIVVLVGLVSVGLGLWAAIDAAGQPSWAFERAGTSKTLWIVLPIVGVLICGVITWVAAIMWFSSYKPRVVAAAHNQPPPGPGQWGNTPPPAPGQWGAPPAPAPGQWGAPPPAPDQWGSTPPPPPPSSPGSGDGPPPPQW